jgi:hypothetical protein
MEKDNRIGITLGYNGKCVELTKDINTGFTMCHVEVLKANWNIYAIVLF